jgi:dTDP-4-amino-4,6-dideoxygalactose transaminase
LRGHGITAPFHYVPLHSSEAGRRFGRASGTLTLTDNLSERLIRLPMWSGMRDEAEHVIASVHDVFC